MPTVQEFAAQIKAKYPQYANVPDEDLAARIAIKYPVYQDQIDFGSEKAKFQAMRSGREAMMVASGGLPGSKTPTAPSIPGSDILPDAAMQTIRDIPGFLGDAAARVGQNVAGAVQGAAHAVAHPIDTVSSYVGDKAQHVTNAARAYLSGDPLTGASESMRVPPGGDLVLGVGKNVVGTLSGDRTAAANLTGDVATAALPEAAGALADIPVVGRALSTVGDKLPSRLMNNMVNTGVRYFRFGNNPGEAMVGIKPSLLEGIDGFKAPLDAKIASLSQSANSLLSHPIANLKSLDVVKEAIEPVINAARQDAIDGGMSTAPVDAADEALHGIVNKYVGADGRITPQAAQFIKQRVGDVTKWASDSEGMTRNGIYQDAYTAIDKLIDEAVPPVKGLNERLANALTAKKVVENAAQMKLKDAGSLRSVLTMPYVRSRAASTLRTIFGQTGDLPQLDVPANDRFSPQPSAYSPDMAATLQRARQPQLQEARPQLALPPAPANSPEGFISSDELRRVGTRLGHEPSQDSSVFAAQHAMPSQPEIGRSGITPPPSQTAPQSLTPPSPPQLIQMLMDRKNSNLLDMVMSKDFRDLVSSLTHEHRVQRLRDMGVFLGGNDAAPLSSSAAPHLQTPPQADFGPTENGDYLENTKPSAVLPARFKTAITATMASPRKIGATDVAPGGPVEQEDWEGRYLSHPDSVHGLGANTALVSRSAGAHWTETLYHELGHAIYEGDLTKQEKAAVGKYFDDYAHERVDDGPGPQTEAAFNGPGQRKVDEFFPELVSMYVSRPSVLKQEAPEGYALVKSIFGGKEYIRR